MSSTRLTRRDFLRLSMTVAGSAALASCAPAATPAPETEDEPVPVEEEVTMRLIAWGNPTEVEAREATNKLFEEAFPNIKVNFLHTPQNYGDKLQTMLAGGDYPDVMYLGNGSIPSYVERGQLAELDPLIARDGVSVSDIFEQNLVLYNVDGKQYGFPADAPSQQLFYNVTMFEEAGVERPSSDWEDPSWDWQRFLEAATALTDEENNQYGWQVKNDFRANWIWITANGGEMFSGDGTACLLNEPPAVEAFQFLADLIHVHKVAPPLDVAAEMGGAELFQGGLTAMETWWPAIGRMRTNITDFEWDVAPHPEGAVTKSCSGGGTGHTLCKNAPFAEAGWEFMKFAITTSFVEKWTEVMGIVPPLQSVAETDTFLQPGKPPEHINVFTDGAAYLRADPRHTKFPQASTIMVSELDYLYAGERSAQEVADSMVEQINKVLQEE
jgi:multiple sugar transport system substrate-binding protein